MRVEGNSLLFSSGKVVYANNGIVGLGSGAGYYYGKVFEGYDGAIRESQAAEDPDGDGLTNAECRELADYMIAEWSRYKETHK